MHSFTNFRKHAKNINPAMFLFNVICIIVIMEAVAVKRHHRDAHHSERSNRQKERLKRAYKLAWAKTLTGDRSAIKIYKEYYACLAKRLKSLTSAQTIIPIITQEGQIVKMECPLCVNPEKGPDDYNFSWQQLARSEVSLKVLETGGRFKITPTWTLIIKEVDILDIGQYYCVDGSQYMAIYQLDVLTDDRRKVVVEGKFKMPRDVQLIYNNLEIYHKWSQWSQCNQCDKPGRRRKIGLCMVKKFKKGKPLKPQDFPLMEMYTDGVPCRSTAIPKHLSKLPQIRNHHTLVVMANCSVKCPTLPPPIKMKGANGKTIVLEPGFYPMGAKPKLPRMVKRKVKYKEAGMHLVLKCPISSDDSSSAVRWQRGKKEINPVSIKRKTRGRVFIDQSNNLHIRKLLMSDTAVYNCWILSRNVATIKVITITKLSEELQDYISYAGFVLTCVLLIILGCCVCCKGSKKTAR